jgi:hypothetical protein
VSLWWALPVLILVAGTGMAAVLLDRLGGELGELDRALRRSGRLGVQTGDLERDVVRLHAVAGGVAERARLLNERHAGHR